MAAQLVPRPGLVAQDQYAVALVEDLHEVTFQELNPAYPTVTKRRRKELAKIRKDL